MYNWLTSKIGKNSAAIVMILWYFLLAYLVVLSFSYENGRFKYAEW
ncbi:hypothetical protein [Pedobacter gandavensis]|nr:hypothetical protein [Pedobacter gandavensis]